MNPRRRDVDRRRDAAGDLKRGLLRGRRRSRCSSAVAAIYRASLPACVLSWMEDAFWSQLEPVHVQLCVRRVRCSVVLIIPLQCVLNPHLQPHPSPSPYLQCVLNPHPSASPYLTLSLSNPWSPAPSSSPLTLALTQGAELFGRHEGLS